MWSRQVDGFGVGLHHRYNLVSVQVSSATEIQNEQFRVH